MGWELFQHLEETRCGLFEPKPAAERKVSFERDGLDTSKACHISARGNVRSRAAGSEAPGQKREDCRMLSALSSLWALSSQPGLRQLVGLSDRSLPDGGPCICALGCVHHIVPVFDLQDFLPIQPYLNQRLVLFWEPEPINFLILPHKVCVLDPEGEFR